MFGTDVDADNCTRGGEGVGGVGWRVAVGCRDSVVCCGVRDDDVGGGGGGCLLEFVQKKQQT